MSTVATKHRLGAWLATFVRGPLWPRIEMICPGKEVCNGGVACSLLKLGSLEKTIIASLFHIFFVEKTMSRYSGERQAMPFFDKKGPKIFMMPN